MTSQNCDLLVSQFDQMFERQIGSVAMVQHDVGHALIVDMSRNGNCRDGQRMGQVEIYSDDSFGATLQQKTRITLEQFKVVAGDAAQETINCLTRAGVD